MAEGASDITPGGEIRIGGHLRLMPFGRAATSALAHAIAAAKQAAGDLLSPVTVVVPSNVAGLSARRLIGSGRIDGVSGLVNVTFVTPSELAATLAPPRVDRVPLTEAELVAAVRAQLADDRDGFFSSGPPCNRTGAVRGLRRVVRRARCNARALARPISRTRAGWPGASVVGRLNHTIDRASRRCGDGTLPQWCVGASLGMVYCICSRCGADARDLCGRSPTECPCRFGAVCNASPRSTGVTRACAPLPGARRRGPSDQSQHPRGERGRQRTTRSLRLRE